MDMNIELYVLLMGAHSFKKENFGMKPNLSEAPHLQEEFEKALEELKTPTCFEFFKQAKELTNVHIHVCGFAGKIWGGEKLEDFNDLVDDIVGIGEYIIAAEEAHLNLFI